MKPVIGASIERITAKFDWDRPGVFLAILLFLGEILAVALAGTSLALEGYDLGRLAALIGAAVLTVYVPLAIWKGKLPFATPTEYEKRRKYAQAILGVRIPGSRDKTQGGWPLGTMQTNLENDREESIRAAVGRAYCLGDGALQNFCGHNWRKDVKQKILIARSELVPSTFHAVAITARPELMDKPQEQEQQSAVAEFSTEKTPIHRESN